MSELRYSTGARCGAPGAASSGGRSDTSRRDDLATGAMAPFLSHRLLSITSRPRSGGERSPQDRIRPISDDRPVPGAAAGSLRHDLRSTADQDIERTPRRPSDNASAASAERVAACRIAESAAGTERTPPTARLSSLSEAPSSETTAGCDRSDNPERAAIAGVAEP